MLKTGNLFEKNKTLSRPLAEELRPQTLQDVVGQDHLLGQGKPLTRFLQAKALPSLILWGPPGCGKTTLARLLAKEADLIFQEISALNTGVADLKKIFEQAHAYQLTGKRTLLFVDEIHRFNRAQQDAFLPIVEQGLVTLVGATTENPSFELNAALLSRTHVMVLHRLDEKALEILLQKAENKQGRSLPIDGQGRDLLKSMSDGDGRTLLNFAESLFLHSGSPLLSVSDMMQVLQRRAPIYDKAQEGHYNLISALHKSIRGSDPDAALYWFCRMVEAGEDCLFIARRLIRAAVEDVGLADPYALNQAIAAKEAFDFLGSPEGNLALAQCVLYLATAPKSNAVYNAYKRASQYAQENGSLTPPPHILNAPTKLMKQLGYGKDYCYDHDTPEAFSGQNYFPESLSRQTFYQPTHRGFEEKLQKRLMHWQTLRNEGTAKK